MGNDVDRIRMHGQFRIYQQEDGDEFVEVTCRCSWVALEDQRRVFAIDEMPLALMHSCRMRQKYWDIICGIEAKKYKTCSCGAKVRPNCMQKHLRSQKHLSSNALD